MGWQSIDFRPANKAYGQGIQRKRTFESGVWFPEQVVLRSLASWNGPELPMTVMDWCQRREASDE